MSATQETEFRHTDRWGRSRQYENRGRPMSEEKLSAFGLWVKNSEFTRKDVAEKLEISKSYVDLMCRGERTPGRALAVKIEKLTGIPVESWDPLSQ